MIGLTSISFRELNHREIIRICAENKVDLIEWGGDIHVPPGDLEKAKKIGIATREQGIQTPSYGSYYRLSENKNIEDSFLQVLDTAEALGARLIRVWTASTRGLTDLNNTCDQSIKELRIICQMAAQRNMAIALEYHRGTLTETKEMTLKILKATGADNLYTYWQMNPDISHKERLEEIKYLKEYICSVHVFYWIAGENKDIRLPLSKGKQYWQEYWELLRDCNCPMIIEFVKDNKIEQLSEDLIGLSALILPESCVDCERTGC